MKVPQIKFSLDKKNGFFAMKNSFRSFCTRADALMSVEPDSVSLLSLSAKPVGSSSTRSSLIDLILKHM